MKSYSHCMQCRMEGWSVNNKWDRIYKQAVLAWSEALSWQLLAGTEKNQKKTQKGSQCPVKMQTTRLPNKYFQFWQLPQCQSCPQLMCKPTVSFARLTSNGVKWTNWITVTMHLKDGPQILASRGTIWTE